MNTLVGIILALHGLVHLWFVTLSQGWVEFQSDMGWSGQSLVLSNLLGAGSTRTLATAFYLLATVGFVGSGVGSIIQHDLWRPVAAASAVLSSVTILLFWDGGTDMLVEKGLLGLLINVGVIVALFVAG
jgi:hypothetical protein